MSQSKQIKSSLFKYQTKSKKKKQRFIFDLTEIDKDKLVDLIQSPDKVKKFRRVVNNPSFIVDPRRDND